MNEYICTDNTAKYVERVETIICDTKDFILDFFEVKDEGQFNYSIYIYDTIEDLRTALKTRGVKNFPHNACSYFKDDDQSLNFFQPKDNPEKDEWSKDEYDLVIYHELIHAIEYTLYGTQPEWISEGIAKYLDGTYKPGIKKAIKSYIEKKDIPSAEDLDASLDFSKCDSYDFAYIMVSYLLETMGKEKFLSFLNKADEVNNLLGTLVERAMNNYEKYFS